MGVFDAVWVAAALAATAPLLLAGMGELISQRAGVINVGLEGMMLFGAFFSYWAALEFGTIWGAMLVGAVAGVAIAAVMAFFSINTNSDQIVVGIGVLILAIGVTSSAFRALFEGSERATIIKPMGRLEIPGLESIPFLGEAVFRQRPVVYLSFLLLPVVWFVLYRTTWGLAVRAAGDLPDAAETAGLSPRRIRWLATLAAGAFAGWAGAFLSVGEVGIFLNQMTSGRGFLAVAAVIFGMWRVSGLMWACLLFGATTALQRRLQIIPDLPREVWLLLAIVAGVSLVYMLVRRRFDWQNRWHVVTAVALAAVSITTLVLSFVQPGITLPSELWLSMPFVVTIAALAIMGARAAAPRYLAIPLIREHD
ncbi:MAG: ABC transporter permease [Acidimicrobiaceae bacterium]|nr:ABC transporter permease [Acidimicrobiaceae bacterium]